MKLLIVYSRKKNNSAFLITSKIKLEIYKNKSIRTTGRDGEKHGGGSEQGMYWYKTRNENLYFNNVLQHGRANWSW